MTWLALLTAATAAWLWAGPKAADARLLKLLRPPAARSRQAIAKVRRYRRPARTAARWRGSCIELCQGVVAELAAGRTPGAALERAIESLDWPDPTALLPVAVAA